MIDFDILTIVLCVIIFLILVFFNNWHCNKYRLFFQIVLFVYLVNVIKLTIFPIPFGIDIENNVAESINLVPFKYGITETSILNIIMTIPFGIIVPFVYLMNLKKILLWGLVFPSVIECTQLTFGIVTGFTFRTIDIDDIIFNFTGVIIGYSVYLFVSILLNKIISKDNKSQFLNYISMHIK